MTKIYQIQYWNGEAYEDSHNWCDDKVYSKKEKAIDKLLATGYKDTHDTTFQYPYEKLIDKYIIFFAKQYPYEKLIDEYIISFAKIVEYEVE